MTVLETVEEFDFSIHNDVSGVHTSNTIDILETISDNIYPLTLINLELPVNSYRITCTKNQNFEEGANCASTVSVEKSFGSDLFSDMIICDSGFNIQEISVFLITGFTNFGVTNQAPQVSFNFVVEDSMLVLYYEFVDIRFCEILDIYEFISNYGVELVTLHSPRASLPLVICSSPHRTSKEGDILHPPGDLLLTIGADITSHGFLFKASIYQLLGCFSYGLNDQALFLSHQLILVPLHGSSFHAATIYH